MIQPQDVVRGSALNRWLVVAAVALALAMALFAGQHTASAQCTDCAPNAGCVDDFTPDSNCTAEDVRIASLVPISTIDPCTSDGDTGTFVFQAELIAGSAERYDIGLFIALDGGSAQLPSRDPNGTSCYHDYLTPIGDPPDPTSGTGPFVNLEDPADGDTCGDIEQGVSTFYNTQEITITCSDSDGDGVIDPISTCTSWDNVRNAKPICTTVADAYPNTKAKCKCEPIAIPTVIIRRLYVDKVTDPPGDPQVFDFTLTYPDNTTVPFSLTDQSDPFDSGLLDPGIYSVAETLPEGWALDDVTCVNDQGTTYPPNAIDLNTNQTVLCTFTNLKAGKIIVDKITDPSPSNHIFDFTVTGPNGFSQDFMLTDPDDPVEIIVSPGAGYAAAELLDPVNDAGWMLTNALCDDGTSSLSGTTVENITVDAGDVINCTFYNTADETSVEMESLSAACTDGVLVVSWVTVSEEDNVGFNVYRSTAENGEAVKLNDRLIDSKAPGSSLGAAYEWVDNTAEAGVTYFYWVENVDSSAATGISGPTSTVCQDPTAVTLTGFTGENASGAAATALPLAAAPLATGLALAIAYVTQRRKR